MCPSPVQAGHGYSCMSYNDIILGAGLDLNGLSIKEGREKLENNPMKTSFTLLANKSTLKECSLECTAHTSLVQTPGCCEYRSNEKKCYWSNSNAVRRLELPVHQEKRAVLCLKGKNGNDMYMSITQRYYKLYINDS